MNLSVMNLRLPDKSFIKVSDIPMLIAWAIYPEKEQVAIEGEAASNALLLLSMLKRDVPDFPANVDSLYSLSENPDSMRLMSSKKTEQQIKHSAEKKHPRTPTHHHFEHPHLRLI